jgi:thiamine phosphate synthase YjbQ (UPF0047 family)
VLNLLIEKDVRIRVDFSEFLEQTFEPEGDHHHHDVTKSANNDSDGNVEVKTNPRKSIYMRKALPTKIDQKNPKFRIRNRQ